MSVMCRPKPLLFDCMCGLSCNLPMQSSAHVCTQSSRSSMRDIDMPQDNDPSANDLMLKLPCNVGSSANQLL